MITINHFVIVSERRDDTTGELLCWNDDEGFVAAAEAHVYTWEESKQITLPIGGRLVPVQITDPFAEIPGAHAALRKAGVK